MYAVFILFIRSEFYIAVESPSSPKGYLGSSEKVVAKYNACPPSLRSKRYLFYFDGPLWSHLVEKILIRFSEHFLLNLKLNNSVGGEYFKTALRNHFAGDDEFLRIILTDFKYYDFELPLSEINSNSENLKIDIFELKDINEQKETHSPDKANWEKIIKIFSQHICLAVHKGNQRILITKYSSEMAGNIGIKKNTLEAILPKKDQSTKSIRSNNSDINQDFYLTRLPAFMYSLPFLKIFLYQKFKDDFFFLKVNITSFNPNSFESIEFTEIDASTFSKPKKDLTDKSQFRKQEIINIKNTFNEIIFFHDGSDLIINVSVSKLIFCNYTTMALSTENLKKIVFEQLLLKSSTIIIGHTYLNDDANFTLSLKESILNRKFNLTPSLKTKRDKNPAGRILKPDIILPSNLSGLSNEKRKVVQERPHFRVYSNGLNNLKRCLTIKGLKKETIGIDKGLIHRIKNKNEIVLSENNIVAYRDLKLGEINQYYAIPLTVLLRNRHLRHKTFLADLYSGLKKDKLSKLSSSNEKKFKTRLYSLQELNHRKLYYPQNYLVLKNKPLSTDEFKKIVDFNFSANLILVSSQKPAQLSHKYSEIKYYILSEDKRKYFKIDGDFIITKGKKIDKEDLKFFIKFHFQSKQNSGVISAKLSSINDFRFHFRPEYIYRNDNFDVNQDTLKSNFLKYGYYVKGDNIFMKYLGEEKAEVIVKLHNCIREKQKRKKYGDWNTHMVVFIHKKTNSKKNLNSKTEVERKYGIDRHKIYEGFENQDIVVLKIVKK